jgi:hypothetical protein
MVPSLINLEPLASAFVCDFTNIEYLTAYQPSAEGINEKSIELYK